MPRLFIRQTYWQTTPLAGRSSSGREPAAASVGGTHTGAGEASLATPSASWQQIKRATFTGRKVWLLLQAQLHQPLPQPASHPDILRQRDYHFRLAAEPRRRTYRLYGYLPFYATEEARYRHAPSAAVGRQWLGRALQADLATLVPHLGQKPQLALALRDLRLLRTKARKYNGRHRLTFDLRFSAPLLLPEYVGVGQGEAAGLGVIRL